MSHTNETHTYPASRRANGQRRWLLIAAIGAAIVMGLVMTSQYNPNYNSAGGGDDSRASVADTSASTTPGAGGGTASPNQSEAAR